MRAAVAFLLALLVCGAAAAQGSQPDEPRVKAQQEREITQPLNNAPVWRQIRGGEPGYIAMPGQEYGQAIMASGETWREFRNGPLTVWGGWLIVLVALAILAYYFSKGQMKLHEPLTGRDLERFSVLERGTHWVAAASFVILALTGLTFLFGKHLLMPLIGHLAFSWWATAAKALHNTFGPIFILSLLLMIPLYAKDNLWRPYDWMWLRRLGGFADHKDVPSGRYNAGEKIWFWLGVMLAGIVVSVSGLVLLFPNFGQQRETIQLFHAAHTIAAVGFIAIGLGHIYLGTIAMQGAYAAMRLGKVDETWAKEHHLYWYHEAKARRGEARPRGQPAQSRSEP
ncbi:MAG: formate dehydrogenase subunit gamma [Betaproteobacteria bacterium]|nr:MAG: formate dehydrogenase subunit gamma [Betaproteobacteria bacterium]